MKLRFEDVAAYDELSDIPAESLTPEAEARITAMTMNKIRPRRRRPLRYIAAAAAVIAALGVTTFAAAERGWFGFDRFFGGGTETVAEHVRNYGDSEDAAYGADAEAGVAAYVRTPEQEQAVAEGWMHMPDSAKVDPATATAETDNYIYTLESMLASPDTLLAVMRVEAKSDAAAAFLDVTEEEAYEKNTDFFMLMAQKVVEYEPTHQFEYENGGMVWELLSRDGTIATFLLSNTGGRFEVGDTVRFQASEPGKCFYVCETTLTDVVEDHFDIDLGSTGTLKLTPVSMQLRMPDSEQEEPDVTLRLKDGTEFTAANLNNGYTCAPCGSCGTMSHSAAFGTDPDDPWEEVTWAFSRIIDPDEIEAVIVGGEEYPVS